MFVELVVVVGIFFDGTFGIFVFDSLGGKNMAVKSTVQLQKHWGSEPGFGTSRFRPTETHTSRNHTASGCLKAIKYSLAKSKASKHQTHCGLQMVTSSTPEAR